MEDKCPSGGALPQEPAADQADHRAQIECCSDLIASDNILGKVADAARSAGWAGAPRPVLLIFLALVSRLFANPVSIATRGQSSVGKSYAIKHALRFFPDDAYLELTGMSEKALLYFEGDLRHRMVILYEHAGIGGGYAAYTVRSLLSEGNLKYIYTDVESARKSRTIEIEGPTGLITSTASSIDPELQTRLVSVNIPDSTALTRAILERQGQEAAGVVTPSVDYEAYRALQELIAGDAHRVVVPFAPILAAEINTTAVRIRRDFPAVMGLVRAHALLHRYRLRTDDHGYLHARPSDYAAVYDLVADTVAEGAQQVVPPEVREVVEAVIAVGQGAMGGFRPVSLGELAKALGLHRTSIQRRVSRAIASGFLADESTGRRGTPKEIVVADPMPEDVGVLPDPEILS